MRAGTGISILGLLGHRKRPEHGLASAAPDVEAASTQTAAAPSEPSLTAPGATAEPLPPPAVSEPASSVSFGAGKGLPALMAVPPAKPPPGMTMEFAEPRTRYGGLAITLRYSGSLSGRFLKDLVSNWVEKCFVVDCTVIIGHFRRQEGPQPACSIHNHAASVSNTVHISVQYSRDVLHMPGGWTSRRCPRRSAASPAKPWTRCPGPPR